MDTIWQGTLTKMRTTHETPVRYHLQDGFWDPSRQGPEICMNDLIGRAVELRFGGEIQCVYCGRKTKKTFSQGFCFPCSKARAEADICIVRPELCHHGKPDDPCRDEAFAQSQCFQPHVLYASLTSGVKVGITRRPNVPSRWMDQGAVAAVPLAELPSRRDVGIVESRLAKEFQDKTHWMTMLKTEVPTGDLDGGVATLLDMMENWDVQGVLPEAERVRYAFTYPVTVWPEKVKSLNLDKAPTVGGRLLGIKAQYLMFDTGVINLRKFTGYVVEVAAD